MWHFFQIKIGFIAIIALILFPFLPANAASNSGRTSSDSLKNISLSGFFQDKCFSSIEDVLAVEKNQTLVSKNKSTEVLRDSLYLSYGLKDHSHKTFKRITLNEIQDLTQNSLGEEWFYVGKYYYIDGFGEELKNILLPIDNSQRATLDTAYKTEQLNTLAEICVQDYRVDDVAKMLELFPESSIWRQYAKFNLAVNLIKNDRFDEGASLLEEITELSSSNEEFGLLSDQANLTLAANYTKIGKLDLAVEYFERIKLGNPQSNSALLGLGWAKFKMSSYDGALRAWLELAKRSKSDAYVHEALMLIPYALEKRGYHLEALAQYNYAIDSFSKQLKNVEEIKSRIKQGEIGRILRSSATSEADFDLRNAIKIMGSELSDGLYDLMVSSEFIQVVKSYHELAELSNNLSKWSQTIPSLRAMPNEEINAYNYRLGTVVNRLKFEYARKIRDRQAVLVEQIDKVNADLAEIKGDDQRILKLREKYRFLSGLLKWNVNADYTPRVQAVTKDAKGQKNILPEVHRPMEPLTFVWKAAPAEHKLFTEAIRDKIERINTLRVKIEKLMSAQEKKAQLLADKDIDQYRKYIKKYHDRALYGKARLYDSMVPRN